MTSPSSTRWLLFAAIGLSMAGIQRSSACGPDFPNAYLVDSLDSLTTLPALSFDRELDRLVTFKPWESEDSIARRHAEAERAEIREVLRAQGVREPALQTSLAAYRRDEPPAELPQEFQLYAKGARAWHEKQFEAATSAWLELLALPPKERRYRTVWAAYMLGRAFADTSPKQARVFCEQARACAATGFADSQELAAAALGWEARAYLREQDYTAALKKYLEQYALHEGSARTSIQLTLRRAFRGGADDPALERADGMPSAGAEVAATSDWQLRELASDSLLRQVITAWFASRGGPSLYWGPEAQQQFTRWIHALPSAADLTPAEADRWCWAAYQNGLWPEARDLAARAPSDAPAAEWVRAMLLLRSGFVGDAAVHLATAAHAFESDRSLGNPNTTPVLVDGVMRGEDQPLGDTPYAQLAGVRGVLALRTEHYTEAIRIFTMADHWADAAYVAERVLSLAELTALVQREYSLPSGEDSETNAYASPLRHLLARRLVRAGKFDAALEFFPPKIVDLYRQYVAAVRTGMDSKEDTMTRAAAFWSAAKIIHEHGMEIQGTELEPDFGLWEGSYASPEIGSQRGHGLGIVRAEAPHDFGHHRDDEGVGATGDELDRLAATKVPGRRYHYRYRAAELAWLAAALSPNDDPRTAEILNTAGWWIAVRDPEQAELFYKSLVVRCAHTDLGRQAAAKHWFIRSTKLPQT